MELIALLCLLLLLFAYNIASLQSINKRQLTVQSPTYNPSGSPTECTDLFISILSATDESGADFASFAAFVGIYTTSNNLQDWILTDGGTGDTKVEGMVANSSLLDIVGKFTLLDVNASFLERIYYNVAFSDWSYFGGPSRTPFNGRQLWNVYGEEIEVDLDIELIDCNGNTVTYPTPIPTERPSESPTDRFEPSMSPTDIPALTIAPSDIPTISPTNCTTEFMNIVSITSDKFNDLYNQIYVGKYVISGSNYENWQHELNSNITGSVDNSANPGSDGYFFLKDSSSLHLDVKFEDSFIDDWAINGGSKISPVGTREWNGEVLEATIAIEIILQDCYGNPVDSPTPAPSNRPTESPTDEPARLSSDEPTASPVCTSSTSATINSVDAPFPDFKVFEGIYTINGTNNDEWTKKTQPQLQDMLMVVEIQS